MGYIWIYIWNWENIAILNQKIFDVRGTSSQRKRLIINFNLIVQQFASPRERPCKYTVYLQITTTRRFITDNFIWFRGRLSRDQTGIVPGLYYRRVHNSRTYEQVRTRESHRGRGRICRIYEKRLQTRERERERDRLACIARLNDLVGQCKRRGLIWIISTDTLTTPSARFTGDFTTCNLLLSPLLPPSSRVSLRIFPFDFSRSKYSPSSHPSILRI